MEKTEVKKESGEAAASLKKPKVPTPKKKRKWPKRVIGIVVVAAVVILILKSCAGGKSGMAAGSYLPGTAAMQDLTVSVSGTGTIEPIHSYKVTTLVKGEVLEAPFQEGQTVKKGNLLFRIDAKDVENAIRQAELSLESAQLNYDNMLKNQEDSRKNATVKASAAGIITKLYVDEGDMVAAGAPIADILDRDNMKLTVPFHSADATGFYEGQSASVTVDGTLETIPGTIDTIAATDSVGPGGTLVRNVTILVKNPGALTDISSGTAAVDAAYSSASGTFAYGESKQVLAKTSGELKSLTAKEGDRVQKDQVMGAFDETDMDTQIKNAAIQVKNAELTLQNSRDRLEDYSITSTIDGTVIEKNYDIGDTIDTSTSAATGITYPAVIYDLSSLTFDMDIDELDINKIKVGQAVEITADALDGKNFTGVVENVNINGTTQSGVTSYPIKVKVNDPGELLPGMNISAKIFVEDAGNVLCIPVDAVSRGGTVLVAGPGALDKEGNLADTSKLEERKVTVGRSNDTFIEIVDGLSEGETVYIQNSASNAMAAMMGG